MGAPLRIANFMDSALGALEKKGNLSHAVRLYNPNDIATKVLHFTLDPADAKYADMFSAHNIEIKAYWEKKPGKWGVLPAVRAFLLVLRELRKHKINVIRARLPYFGGFVGCLAGKMLRIPSVVSLGGNNRLSQEREGKYCFGSKRLSYAVEKTVLMMCDAIIVPNSYTKEYVASILGDRRAGRKVRTIPWILESALESKDKSESVNYASLGIEETIPFVLIVGHINKYKYSLEMFEMAKRLLSDRNGEVQIVFCGDGPLRREGEARFQEMKGIRFLGWQSNETVITLMRSASAVLVPMSGFVLLEAASLGKPVIASSIEWHNEIVEDRLTGMLVDPEDVDAWCKHLVWMLDNPEEASCMGRKLKERFNREFLPETLLRKEESLYRELVRHK